MIKVFANGLGDQGSIPGQVIPKTQKWYLVKPCLTLRIIRYGPRVKWSNLGKGVAPSPTSQCCSYWKGSLRVTLNYGHQLYLFTFPEKNSLVNKGGNYILFLYFQTTAAILCVKILHLCLAIIINEPELICLHTVKWFQVLLSNTKYSICFLSFVCS